MPLPARRISHDIHQLRETPLQSAHVIGAHTGGKTRSRDREHHDA